jgi:flagellar hook-length control protein FliK
MLPGFLPQSTPPAPPPAGGGLATASGADAFNAGTEGEAFTSALDSACDAQSTCADSAQSNSADRPAAGTSPRMAAWLLALARGANPPGDAVANEHGTQQAPPFSEDDGAGAPVIGDSVEAEEAPVAAAGNPGDATGAVILAPIAGSTPVADAPLPQAAATSSDAPVAEHSDDSAKAVGGGSAAAAEAGRAPGRHSQPDAASRDGLSAADREAPANRAEFNSRSGQARPPDDAGTKAQASGAAGEPVAGADEGASEASADVGWAQSQAPSSDRSPTADARGVAGHRPASAGSAVAHASSASQGTATATAAAIEPGAVANSGGTQPTQPDATVGAATGTGDARPVTTPVSTSEDDVSQDAFHRGASQSGYAQGGASQSGASQSGASQSGASQSGAASSHDSWRQNQDAEGPGRDRRLDVAVTRSAAAAMLTLVAGPDGALRLTPATMAAPVLAPILPQDQTANIDQLVQTMRVMVKEQLTEATVHLRPQHFGEVSIQVRLDGKSVSAIIQTESSQVRDWMLGQEGTLRSGLSEQGLQLERLVVQRDGRQDRRDNGQQQPERRRQRQRHQSESQQTFEITV